MSGWLLQMPESSTATRGYDTPAEVPAAAAVWSAVIGGMLHRYPQ